MGIFPSKHNASHLTFHRFTSLPPELRYKIFQIAAQEWIDSNLSSLQLWYTSTFTSTHSSERILLLRTNEDIRITRDLDRKLGRQRLPNLLLTCSLARKVMYKVLRDVAEEHRCGACSCKEGGARGCFLEVVVEMEGLRVFKLEDVIEEEASQKSTQDEKLSAEGAW